MDERNDPGVWLQGLGLHVSKPAAEIRPGDVLVWNYGSSSRVASVEDISRCFLRVTFPEDEHGRVHSMRFKKTRRVAWAPKATAEARS